MIRSASKDVKAAVAWAGSDIIIKFFTANAEENYIDNDGQWVQHVSI